MGIWEYDLSDSFEEIKEELEAMSSEEREKHFFGNWELPEH